MATATRFGPSLRARRPRIRNLLCCHPDGGSMFGPTRDLLLLPARFKLLRTLQSRSSAIRSHRLLCARAVRFFRATVSASAEATARAASAGSSSITAGASTRGAPATLPGLSVATPSPILSMVPFGTRASHGIQPTPLLILVTHPTAAIPAQTSGRIRPRLTQHHPTRLTLSRKIELALVGQPFAAAELSTERFVPHRASRLTR